VIAASFRGFIAEAGVRSGDIVKKDQPMCSLDDRDLRVERARVASEREEHLLEHRKAMAEGLRFGLAIAALMTVPIYLIYYAVQPWPGAWS